MQARGPRLTSHLQGPRIGVDRLREPHRPFKVMSKTFRLKCHDDGEGPRVVRGSEQGGRMSVVSNPIHLAINGWPADCPSLTGRATDDSDALSSSLSRTQMGMLSVARLPCVFPRMKIGL